MRVCHVIAIQVMYVKSVATMSIIRHAEQLENSHDEFVAVRRGSWLAVICAAATASFIIAIHKLLVGRKN
jgi:hypothetical protein